MNELKTLFDQSWCFTLAPPLTPRSFNPVPNADAERRLLEGIFQMYETSVLPQVWAFGRFACCSKVGTKASQLKACGYAGSAHESCWQGLRC